jgi:hypothetical protein
VSTVRDAARLIARDALTEATTRVLTDAVMHLHGVNKAKPTR